MSLINFEDPEFIALATQRVNTAARDTLEKMIREFTVYIPGEKDQDGVVTKRIRDIILMRLGSSTFEAQIAYAADQYIKANLDRMVAEQVKIIAEKNIGEIIYDEVMRCLPHVAVPGVAQQVNALPFVAMTRFYLTKNATRLMWPQIHRFSDMIIARNVEKAINELTSPKNMDNKLLADPATIIKLCEAIQGAGNTLIQAGEGTDASAAVYAEIEKTIAENPAPEFPLAYDEDNMPLPREVPQADAEPSAEQPEYGSEQQG